MTNKVCLNVGVSATLDTIVLYVYTFPNCTRGAPFMLLALLLGAGDSGGLESNVTCGIESLSCWLDCSNCSIKALSCV